MTTILQNILTHKRKWIEKHKQTTPLSAFKSHITTNTRPYYSVLQDNRKNKDMTFILECKRSRPGKGDLRPHFSLVDTAKTYAPYASVVSILTDEQYFRGSFSFLHKAKGVTHAPILCKDFFVDPYQVYYARYMGADAILLMLSVLDDTTYGELSNLAHTLNMGVLTEISTAQEAQRATKLKAKVIGINNRNLRDLSIDLHNTKNLRKFLPQDTVVISESGIKTFADTVSLRSYCDGFLVGSSLMEQKDIDRACRALLFGKNKVCGLRTPKHAVWAKESGAIFGGLIFVKNSKRFVDEQKAKNIMDAAALHYVGVFQDEPVQNLITLSKNLNLYGVQLHGQEDTAYVQAIRRSLPNIKIFKALAIDKGKNVFPPIETRADYYILDTRVHDVCGGTGVTFNWAIIPDTIKDSCLLAGGIGGKDVQRAAQQGCMGLDMNSRLEDDNGQKDKHKIFTAFDNLKKQY